MSSTCTACGVELPAASRFCHACGATRPGAPPSRFASPLGYTPAHLVDRILTHRSALEGEHKIVTVLFCDVVNSSALAERLGPERMHEMFERLFEDALDVIHLYEGTVNQFLGDGFMALFGAPLAIEHHERQALLAALALRDRLPGHVGGADASIQTRIGVHTGPVVVGKIGDNLRMDYTAVGDTTNVAARLQGLAAPGMIYASAVTYERARRMFQGEALGPLSLAGRTAPVSAYRILGRLPSRSTRQPEGERPSPFVGRARELAALQAALAEVERDQGQLVGIMGDAGLGKSRLLAEFRRSLAGRRLTWLEGHCVPYGGGMPYLPILELLRANCGLADTDSPEEIAAKVHTALAEVGLEAGAAPYLLHLLGVKEGGALAEQLGPETIKTRTFKALVELAVRGSRRRPIIFVVEDLHWIDQGSLEFLLEVAEATAGAPILLLATYRPGYAWPWVARSYATQIALHPLAEADSLTVVDSALRDAAGAAGVREHIAARGEGNPFFLEELARTVVEQGVPSAGARIPETLHGLLMSRIDRLPEDAKRTLQLASVIGREFSARLLLAVAADAERIEDHLRRLARHEFLRARTTAGEPAYVFKHALTRDVVYGSLLERHRRQAHTRVGLTLERLQAGRIDEVAEVLAHHFGLGDDDARAVDYAIRAAARAQRRWANAEALAFAEAALKRLAAMPDTRDNQRRRIDVIIQQAEVRFALGQHGEHIAALESIRALIDTEAADARRRAAWYYWTGFLHSLTGGRPETAIAYCREASAIAEREGLEDIRAFADACLAQAYHVAGDLAAAVAAGERALATFERRGDVWWMCRALSQLSAIENSRGEWEQGLGYCRRALAHGQALDDLRLKVSALVRLASTEIQRGDPAAGLPFCEQALAANPTPYDAAAARAIHGYGLIKSGRVTEGVAELAEALAFYERSRLRYTRAQFSLWLAEGSLLAGERERARPILDGVLAVTRELGYRGLEGIAERLLGECGGPDAAAHFDTAERILREVGARNELAKTLAARAR